jgi:hypothetical protein
MVASDEKVMGQIEELVDEEHRLLKQGEGGGLDQREHERLEQVRVELDRCWDLLRRRRAREEFGLDPDQVRARDPETVEGYEG